MQAHLMALFIFFSTAAFGQILVGGEDPVEPKDKKEERNKDSLKKPHIAQDEASTSIYFITNYSLNKRLLTENGELFGDTLGTRADEFGFSTWSFGVGLQNKLTENFFWDGGIGLYRNGEQYLFEETDTMFAYQNIYNYVVMPIRINAAFGKTFRWGIGTGLMPQMFTGYRQEQQWKTTSSSSGDETIKTKIGYNSFVISALFNASLAIDMSTGWSLLISPEARFQLNTSYGNYSPYIHKSRSYGVSIGLLKHL